MYSTREHIHKTSTIRIVNFSLVLCIILFWLYKSIIWAVEMYVPYSFSNFIGFIFPVAFTFLLVQTIHSFLKHRRKVMDIGCSKFQINEENFIYMANNQKELIVDKENIPISMRRNFESFLIQTEKEIISINFSDYCIKKAELDCLKQNFDKLKNYLFD